MEKEAVLLDNVESSWRGILDLSFNERDNQLYGVTSTPVYFGLWAAPLENIKYEESTNLGRVSLNLASYKNSEVCKPVEDNKKKYMQIVESQKILEKNNIDINLNMLLGPIIDKNISKRDSSPNNNYAENFDIPEELEEKKSQNLIPNTFNNPFNKKPTLIDEKIKNEAEKDDSTLFELGHENQNLDESLKVNNEIFDESSPKNNNESNSSPNLATDLDFEQKNKEKEKPLSNQNNRQKIASFDNSIINANQNFNFNELHFSSFIIDKDNNDKYLQFDIINDVKHFLLI